MRNFKFRYVMVLLLALTMILPGFQVAEAQSSIIYQQGDRDPGIVTLKKKLNSIGFGKIQETNYYGAFTTKKVKEFQTNYRLAVTGKVDQATLNKLNEVYNSPFQVGKRNQQTIQLKKQMNALGFGTIQETNLFGSFMAKKVKEFQRFAGLKDNGIADAYTRQLIAQGFKVGDNHAKVIELKRGLNMLKFGGINVTEYYGDFTGKRVREFQVYYGLQATGTATPETFQKLTEILNSPFQLGKRHPDTIELKNKLNKIGFEKIIVTNLYGSAMTQKVKDFQTIYGLKAHGIADQLTWDKVNEIYNSPFQVGKSDPSLPTFKKKLNWLGYGKIQETTYFGTFLEGKVKQFQADNQLPVSGIGDYHTIAKLDQVFEATFQEGQRHESIKELKRALNRLDFGKITVSDLYGSFTTKKVSDFQGYYGLSVTGTLTYETAAKIDQILNSPLQKGKSNAQVLQLKEDLNYLGYGPIQLTKYFGDYAESQVKQFQRDNSLPASGIADELTLTVLAQKVADKETDRTIIYTPYTKTLQEALTIQMNGFSVSDKYWGDAYVSASPDYVELTEQGTITGNPVNLRTSPDHTKSNVAYTVPQGTSVIILATIEGTKVGTSTKWYQINYQNEVLYVHTSLASKMTIGTTKVNLNVRSGKSTSSQIYQTLPAGSRFIILENGTSWHRIKTPTEYDIIQHLDPANVDEFEHLNLSGVAGISQSVLGTFLKNKGVLTGTEASFIEAANASNVNEVYLVTHALHETGNGTSTLAKGVYVDQNGNTIRDSNGNLITDPAKVPAGAVKVYNFYGIAAYDSNPTNGGARYAFNKGWTTIEKAIKGGADWISSNYVNHPTYQQNTIYKMRWNPGNPGTHQYATDIAWASKQTSRIKQLYEQIPNALLRFDIPVYKN